MNQSDSEPSGAEGAALARWIKWVNLTPKIAACVLLFLVAAYVIAFWQNGWSKSPDAWGQLGDYIGGLLNPLVAGFALMALVVSVRLQKAELTATRKELENSRVAMQEQAKTAEQQRTEQRFFDLLNIYHRTVDTTTHMLDVNRPGIKALGESAMIVRESKHFKGKDALSSRKDEILREVGIIEFGNQRVRGDFLSDDFSEPYSNFKKMWLVTNHPRALGSYFRVVFRILSESEALLGDQHFRYSKLFRAQLNDDELTLLGLNLWLDEEGSMMLPFAVKYGLLKHLQKGTVREALVHSLPVGVFGRTWARRIGQQRRLETL